MVWTVRGWNPGGDQIFRTYPDRPWGPPSLLYSGYRVFPGGKERPGRDADPSPPSSAVVMKGYSYTSTPPMGRTAYTEPQCLYRGALYLYLYLSACTRVHFTLPLPQCLYKGALYLYLYLSACTRVPFTFTSVPVQGCTLPLPLPQCLYKGALFLYLYLSACTRVTFTFTFTCFERLFANHQQKQLCLCDTWFLLFCMDDFLVCRVK